MYSVPFLPHHKKVYAHHHSHQTVNHSMDFIPPSHFHQTCNSFIDQLKKDLRDKQAEADAHIMQNNTLTCELFKSMMIVRDLSVEIDRIKILCDVVAAQLEQEREDSSKLQDENVELRMKVERMISASKLSSSKNYYDYTRPMPDLVHFGE